MAVTVMVMIIAMEKILVVSLVAAVVLVVLTIVVILILTGNSFFVIRIFGNGYIYIHI